MIAVHRKDRATNTESSQFIVQVNMFKKVAIIQAKRLSEMIAVSQADRATGVQTSQAQGNVFKNLQIIHPSLQFMNSTGQSRIFIKQIQHQAKVIPLDVKQIHPCVIRMRQLNITYMTDVKPKLLSLNTVR